MLFLTDSIQLVQRNPYHGNSRRMWRFHNRGKEIPALKFADNLVQLAKKETVLHGMINRLMAIGDVMERKCMWKNLSNENFNETIPNTDYDR